MNGDNLNASLLREISTTTLFLEKRKKTLNASISFSKYQMFKRTLSIKLDNFKSITSMIGNNLNTTLLREISTTTLFSEKRKKPLNVSIIFIKYQMFKRQLSTKLDKERLKQNLRVP